MIIKKNRKTKANKRNKKGSGAKSVVNKTARKTCINKFCKDYIYKKTKQNWVKMISRLENKKNRTPEEEKFLSEYKSPGFLKNLVALDQKHCPNMFCNPGCEGEKNEILKEINILDEKGFHKDLNRTGLQKLGALSGCTLFPNIEVENEKTRFSKKSRAKTMKKK
jgi:hypothetical protein